jgi:hypothetical protein
MTSQEKNEIIIATKIPTAVIDIVGDYMIPYGECWLCCDARLFEICASADRYTPIKIYCSGVMNHNTNFELDDFEKAYRGRWVDMSLFAKKQCGNIDDQYNDHFPICSMLSSDMDAVWEAMSIDYYVEDGHVFWVTQWYQCVT